jgi:hypothetical protein
MARAQGGCILIQTFDGRQSTSHRAGATRGPEVDAGSFAFHKRQAGALPHWLYPEAWAASARPSL